MASIDMTRGDTWEGTLTVKQSGTIVDITGYEVILSVKESVDDTHFAVVSATPYDNEPENLNHQLYGWDLGSTASSTNTDTSASTPITTGKLYVSLSDSGGTRTVSLYSDSDRTTLVSQGTSVGDGIVTLTEQGGSGLAGTVSVAHTADSTSIELVAPFNDSVDLSDSANGKAAISILPSQTSSILFPDGKSSLAYIFDIEVTTVAGKRYTVTDGSFTLKADVSTRPSL